MFWRVKKGGSEEMKRRYRYTTSLIAESIAYSFTSNLEKISEEKYIKKLFNKFSLFLPYPVSIRLPSQDLINEMNSLGDKIILIEGIQSSLSFFMIKKELRNRVILRIHNWESNYHREMAISSVGFRKILHNLVALQYKVYEKILFSYQIKIAHISEDEKKLMEVKFNASKHYLMPPIAKSIIDINNEKREIVDFLIMGDMSISGNYVGAEWFAKNVWPALLEKWPDRKLHIVGINSEKIRGSGIISHGYVENLKEFIENNKTVSIIAVAKGGGVKIKTIDTMVSGIPAIYSIKSLEGLMHKEDVMANCYNYTHGNFSSAFIACCQAVENIENTHTYTEYLKKYCLENYSEHAYEKSFNAIRYSQ
ncbi:glycosyltransferase [Deinococcus actinosclerus]|uniref:glycosyltransferase n=1 Tax=Deinococcus actinosclerus TaxID=1768108 RepID=UPI0009E8F6EC|nr:glycosyltransferase [Deinococcus actinosclerus]